MQADILKNIVEDIAGKQAREIVDLLMGKKDVNEFIIAKKLKSTINQTRNILYKLSDNGLVSFTRKKDKRKGWYIYFWTLDSLKSLEILEKKLLLEIEQLKNQLKNRKLKRFYLCKTCNVETSEETALLNQFTCIECGQVYSLAESDKIIKELENKINKIKKTVDTIREETGKLEVLREKKAQKEAKKGKKEKKKGKKKSKKKGKGKTKKRALFRKETSERKRKKVHKKLKKKKLSLKKKLWKESKKKSKKKK